MKILQLNLNHCEAAHDLLTQTVREMDIDVAILSEPYRNTADPRSWTSDASGRATVWACGRRFVQERPSTPPAGFSWARVDGIYIYSVYAPPSATQGDFEDLLNELAENARSRRPHIIAGDFNAWATEWGSRETNRRGMAPLDFAASLEAALLNTGSTPTFTRDGNSSIIDVTFISESLSPRVISWQVSDHCTHNDNQAIVLEIAAEGKRRTRGVSAPVKWNA